MMRRTMWLAAGAALGAAGTRWASRRLETLASRARRGEIPGDVIRLVEGGADRLSRRVSGAVDVGRAEARRRRHQLRSELEARR